MAYLFEIRDNEVYPTPEVLLIEPFKSIWRRDKLRSKRIAIEELTYIEFVSSIKKSNPFREYSDDIRPEKVKEFIISDEKWKPDKKVLAGIKVIEDFQENASASLSYFKAAKSAIEKMQNFLNTFKFTDVNEKTGLPLYKPNDITRAVGDTTKLLSSFKKLRSMVEEEIYETIKTKGDKEISPLAYPSSLQK